MQATKLIIISACLLFGLFACQHNSADIIKDDIAITSSPVDYKALRDHVTQYRKKIKHQRSFLSDVELTESTRFFLDQDSISEEDYNALKTDNLVFTYRQSYFDRQVAAKQTKGSKRLNGWKTNYFSHTKDYYEHHEFTPRYVSLSLNEYDLLGLTLQTDHIGPLHAVAFNKNTGDALAQYNEISYDGGYYVGINVADKQYSEIGLIGVVGDSIFYQEFGCDEL